MTEYELNAFRSEFDPVALADSLKADPTPANRAKQFSILQTSYFLAFGKGPGQVSVLHNKQGDCHIAAFTCREELEKWPFPRETVQELPFSTLKGLIEQDARLSGVVIDPFGRSLVLNRSHFADMERTLRAAAPKKALKMKATLDYPMGLPLAVKELMQSHPEVYRVWLLAAHFEGEHTDRKLFVVDFDGQPGDLFPQLAQAVKLYLRQGEGVEMMKANISLLRAAEQAAKPIYVKE